MNGMVGILGGTFDPIHQAHLALAEGARELLELDAVYLLVNRRPPHKDRLTASAWHRFAMTALAAAGSPGLIPCALELEQTGYSYTIYSLERFREWRGLDSRQMIFLAGFDSLRDFPAWREAGRLQREFRFLFAARPGVPLPDHARERIESGALLDWRHLSGSEIRQRFPGCGASLLVELGLPDISSTAIRAMLESQQDISRLVPAPVARYIEKVKLYGGK